jgi:CRP-like cAMP-binding protein
MRTLRGKILSYIINQGETTDRIHYTVHLSRSEMADYLCVNRSAMTRELGKMREEGILAFSGNKFTVYKKQILQQEQLSF